MVLGSSNPRCLFQSSEMSVLVRSSWGYQFGAAFWENNVATQSEHLVLKKFIPYDLFILTGTILRMVSI